MSAFSDWKCGAISDEEFYDLTMKKEKEMNKDKKMKATWKIRGILALDLGLVEKDYVVRYTSDNIGKSLSIADEENGVMFQIPFDAIYKEICNT